MWGTSFFLSQCQPGFHSVNLADDTLGHTRFSVRCDTVIPGIVRTVRPRGKGSGLGMSGPDWAAG